MKCDVCEKDALYKCENCFTARYCSEEHRKGDWKRHFTICVQKLTSSLKDRDLLDAAHSGNLNAVKRALNTGAQIDVKDRDGKTPFHFAA